MSEANEKCPKDTSVKKRVWPWLAWLLVLLACVLVWLFFLRPARITGIALPQQLTLEKGAAETLQPQYTAAYPGWRPSARTVSAAQLQKAADRLALVWTAEDTAVVQVDDSGCLSAVGGGETVVTVRSTDGRLSASCRVTVTVPPTAVLLPQTLALQLGGQESQSLHAALQPADAAARLCYESSDDTVATVTADGTVTAVGVGRCTVTATAEGYPAVAAKTTVEVTQTVTQLAIQPEEGVLTVGESLQATVAFLPPEAALPPVGEVSVTVENESVASAQLDDGFVLTVRGLAAGETDITVRYRQWTAALHLTVQAKKASAALPGTSTSAQPGASGPADSGSAGGGTSGSDGGSTVSPAVPSKPSQPQRPVPCPVDGCQLRADGSCPMDGVHWMYTTPTNGYAFSAACMDAWRAAAANPEVKDIYGNPGNVAIPGGGIGDTPRCDNCGGEVVIVGPGPTLGCSNGCW